MKQMNISMALRTVATILVTCATSFAQDKQNTPAGAPPIGNVRWILGTWESTTSRGTIFETWKKVSDDEFSGKSYAVRGQDTLVFERVQLIQKQGSLFYIPIVTDQNQGKPVSFKSKSVSSNEMTFENPGHDFPQQITYTQVPGDSLHAVVSGMVNGKLKLQKFRMRRLQP